MRIFLLALLLFSVNEMCFAQQSTDPKAQANETYEAVLTALNKTEGDLQITDQQKNQLQRLLVTKELHAAGLASGKIDPEKQALAEQYESRIELVLGEELYEVYNQVIQSKAASTTEGN